MISGLANFTLGRPVGPVKPYLLAGLGAFDLANSPDGGSSDSKIHFGINAGAGLEVRLGPIFAFAESRFENVYTDSGVNTGLVSDGKFAPRFVPVTFGLVY